MATCKVFEEKDDWKKFRAGFFTASEISKLLTEPRKKGELLSVGAKTYIKSCVSELFAPPKPDFYNSAMEHGTETEPFAVMRVARELGKDMNDDNFIYTSEGGFVFYYNEEYNLGGTPDLILFDDKMICEIKCPQSDTHLDYLLLENAADVYDAVPNYYGQMQLNMFLTETDKCLFISYDNRFYDEAHHYHSVVVPRDEDYILNMLDKAKKATEYKENLIKILNQKIKQNEPTIVR